jgi:calcineurin-like phosphoesterase family protein
MGMKRILASVLTIAVLIFSGFVGDALGQGVSNNSKVSDSKASTNSKGSPPASSAAKPSLPLSLPLKDGSLRFAIIGDTGSGTEKQRQVADMMVRYRAEFPFEFVLMMGDNLYGGETAQDFQKKFSDVYKRLLDDKVKFYATLGNHDLPNQIYYEKFNMNGKEYYRFKKGNVAFYSLNSNYMDKRQVKWLENELAMDVSEWKICFFHHPPYSSGKKHGSDTQLREVVEPIFLKYGVNLVLAGHDHFYERIKPQKGIYYLVSGAGGQLRAGDVKRPSPLTEKSFDKDMHFVLVEVVGDQLHFQVISRTGETVDSGILMNQRKAANRK